jgi:hypothetical protein
VTSRFLVYLHIASRPGYEYCISNNASALGPEGPFDYRPLNKTCDDKGEIKSPLLVSLQRFDIEMEF